MATRTVEDRLAEWVDGVDCDRQVGVPGTVSMTAYEQEKVIAALKQLCEAVAAEGASMFLHTPVALTRAQNDKVLAAALDRIQEDRDGD